MKVKRGVILAAGKGTRLAPITDVIPKPLVKIKDKCIIETQIEALLASGINEIYIVRGYMKGAFDALLTSYPMLKFIENPYFETANNISSVVCAGELVKNAYIIEGDLYVMSPDIILAEQTVSNYLAVPVNETDDWCFFTDGNRKIERIAVGGKNCEKMVGISYWSETDGERLQRHAKELFEKDYGKQKYWDEIALDEYLGEYEIYVRRCNEGDVAEIDTFAELCAIDNSYLKWSV